MSKKLNHVKKDLITGFRFQKTLTPAMLLGLILFLGITLRFYDLGTESYWIDEMSTIIEAQQSIPQMITSGRLDQPPAFYIPFHFWVQIFGTAEVSTRTFSALVGTGAIVLIYLIGRELFGKKVGLLSAFLMAISWFQIYYSQIARFYIFFEFMALLSFLFFILALREKKIIYFALYGVASILMIYSHTYGVFILAAQNLFFLLQGKKDKKLIIAWLICQILVMVAFVPSFYILVKGESGIRGAVASNIGACITAPTLKDLVRTIYNYLFPQNYQHNWVFIAASFAAGLAFFVLVAFFNNFQKVKNRWLIALKSWFQISRIVPQISSEFVLVVLWVVCPILLPFIYSNIFTPIFLARYTICAAPAFYLLVAAAISRIRRIVPVYITLIALMIVVLPGLQDYYSADVNEQWREAAAYVQENTQTNDVIVFAPDQGDIQHESFDWYFPGAMPACSISSGIKDDHSLADVLSNCTLGHERYWVIIRGTQEVVNRMKSFFLNPDKTAFRLTKEQEFVQISVYLFELKK